MTASSCRRWPTRILEVKEDGIVDFQGNYEEYLASQGIE